MHESQLRNFKDWKLSGPRKIACLHHKLRQKEKEKITFARHDAAFAGAEQLVKCVLCANHFNQLLAAPLGCSTTADSFFGLSKLCLKTETPLRWLPLGRFC
jgi:hypothetical protein